jgi:PEP-CTERM motif-containing protein
MMLTNSFEMNNSVPAWDLKPSTLDTFILSKSDTDIGPAVLTEHDSSKGAFPISHAEKAWHVATTRYREGRTGEHERKRKLVPILVPEPGALSLLLLGLATVGFSAGRRRDPPTIG